MTGLVLEGGAMRGMFTAGVIDVMMENGLTVDGAIGVSAGATFGCNIKSHQIGRAIRYNKKFGRNWRYCSFCSLLKTGDLYGADFCYNRLPNELDLFDYETYRSNPMKFIAVATDIVTGKPVYKELKTCDEKDLTWMRASASMPLVSKEVSIDGYFLLDGGISDSIPLKYMQSLGYEKNIVVLTQERGYQKKKDITVPLLKIKYKKFPALIDAMKNRHVMYNEETDYVFAQEKLGNTLVISPDRPLNISRIEKNPNELERVYQIGRTVAEEKLAEIKAFLSKTEL